MALLLSKKELFKKIVYNEKAILLSVLFCTFLSFWFSKLVTYSFVQYVVVDILGEDLTLTGRLGIYEILLEAMAQNPLWGWGQGNGMSFLGYFFSTPNAQNGLFNYITDYGIIGAGLLLCLLYTVCKRVQDEQSYPLLALIFTFIILSSVEITFNLQFITYIMMLIPFIANPTKCFQRKWKRSVVSSSHILGLSPITSNYFSIHASIIRILIGSLLQTITIDMIILPI